MIIKFSNKGGEATKLVYAQIRAEKIDLYNLNPTCCNECNTVLPYEKRKNRYCSYRCSSKNKKHTKSKPLSFNKCLRCGSDTSNPKFCGHSCQKLFERDQKIQNGTASSKSMKRLLLETNGNVCSCCGISEWNKKPIVMDLEHIDGNYSNNDISNLCLLCPNCHSQTDTFKGRNKGNGRHSRKQNFKENSL